MIDRGFSAEYNSGQLTDPEMGANWVSVANYFGEGSTWNGEVLSLIRPVVQSLERLPSGISKISASGYPGRNYRLFKPADFVNWSVVTNQNASAGGALVFLDGGSGAGSARFYRVSTP